MIASLVLWFLLCLRANVESHGTTVLPDRITGGEPADITDFPYQLAMEVFMRTTYNFICGASIIRRSWAISAGHCVSPIQKSEIRLRSGSSYIMRGGTLHYAEKVIIHPNYSEDLLMGTEYDVAIIKVSTPFHYSDVTQKISMACKTPSPGTEAVVSGWGGVNEKGELSDQLQQLTVNIMDLEDCKRSDPFFNLTLTPSMLCANVPEGGKSVFYGDSGGPLVVDKTLVGIVSFSHGRNFLYIPAAYTDVARIRKWVTESIQQELLRN